MTVAWRWPDGVSRFRIWVSWWFWASWTKFWRWCSFQCNWWVNCLGWKSVGYFESVDRRCRCLCWGQQKRPGDARWQYLRQCRPYSQRGSSEMKKSWTKAHNSCFRGFFHKMDRVKFPMRHEFKAVYCGSLLEQNGTPAPHSVLKGKGRIFFLGDKKIRRQVLRYARISLARNQIVWSRQFYEGGILILLGLSVGCTAKKQISTVNTWCKRMAFWFISLWEVPPSYNRWTKCHKIIWT